MTSKRNGDEEYEPDPATWIAAEERIFIHLMVKEVHKGNGSTTTSSRKGWRHIEEDFHQRTNKKYTNSQFRNKFNQLRTRCHEFTKLLREPGFRYDPILNSLVAGEDVWAIYSKVNKHAKRFRKKGCPFFNELGIIFDEQDLKYKDVYPLTTHFPFENGEDKVHHLEDASTNDTPSAFPSNSSDDEDYHLSSVLRRRLRSPTPKSHFKAKRELRSGGMRDRREWGEGEAIKGRSPTMTPSVTKPEVGSPSVPSGSAFSITKCVKCLESIEGVDESTYIKALKMFKDPD